jgi:hypothetical protein
MYPETKWGTRAIVQYLDGRKIELIMPKT